MKFWEAMKALQEGYKVRIKTSYEGEDAPILSYYFKLSQEEYIVPSDPIVKVLVYKDGQVDGEEIMQVKDYADLMTHIHCEWEVIY